MNYRRGLQRLYIVLTAGWIGIVVFAVVYREWQPQSLFNGGWQTTGIPLNEELRAHWPSIVAVSVMPPALGYLVIFKLLPWIGNGFRSPD